MMRKFFDVCLALFQFVVLPPLVVACGAWMVWGPKSALPAFLFALGVDIVIGFCVNSFTSAKIAKTMADLEKERMDYERGQVIGVSCAKCSERNLVPLDLRIEGFTCKKCGQKNKLFYNFYAESVFDLRREDFTKEDIAAKLKENIGENIIWDNLEKENG